MARQDGFIFVGMAGRDASWVKPNSVTSVFDSEGEWLRNEAIIEFSEPDDALPDLDNPATKSWVLQQLRELTGLPALHANFERGRGWTVYSIPLGDSAYVRTGWHSTEGDAIVSAYLLAMGPGGES